MRKVIALLIILLLQCLLVAQTTTLPAARPLVFTHVTVIDVTGSPSKSNMTVIVEGNRITALGRAGEIRVPKGAQVVDAKGKFLIPGLWDMHVHALGKSRESTFFPLFIANGVTGVRNMHTVLPLGEVVRIREDVAAGKTLAPRIFANGPLADGPHEWNHAGSLLVSTADEARRAVDSLAAGGADFIKVYDGLSREGYFALAESAKRRGIPFAGHIPNRVTAEEASDAGQRSVEHMYGLNFPCQTTGGTTLRNPKASGAGDMSAPGGSVRVAPTPCDRTIAAFKRNRTWQVPTIVLYWSRTVADSILSDRSRIKYVSPETRERWHNFVKGTPKEQADKARLEYETLSDNLRLLHRAGVPILSGTDVGNPFLVPGFSLHDELSLFVQAGMTPLEALRTATINPAKYLSMQDKLGTIERGKLADLVLLNANPLADISNTKKISAVVVNGRLLGRDALDKMLADAEASANKK